MSGGITTVIPDFEGAEAVITTGLRGKDGKRKVTWLRKWYCSPAYSVN